MSTASQLWLTGCQQHAFTNRKTARSAWQLRRAEGLRQGANVGDVRADTDPAGTADGLAGSRPAVVIGPRADVPERVWTAQ
jgi:hypothetical protein